MESLFSFLRSRSTCQDMAEYKRTATMGTPGLKTEPARTAQEVLRHRGGSARPLGLCARSASFSCRKCEALWLFGSVTMSPFYRCGGQTVPQATAVLQEKGAFRSSSVRDSALGMPTLGAAGEARCLQDCGGGAEDSMSYSPAPGCCAAAGCGAAACPGQSPAEPRPAVGVQAFLSTVPSPPLQGCAPAPALLSRPVGKNLLD